MKKNSKVKKTAYVCGPLTELPPEIQGSVKSFYEKIADVCFEVLGVRAFVPHEHFDPIKHAQATPQDVDYAERKQVCENTSVLIVVAIAPSWGGGIEVEMAYRSKVPVVILCEKEKLDQRKISRLLRGNPGIYGRGAGIISYDSQEFGLRALSGILSLMQGSKRLKK